MSKTIIPARASVKALIYVDEVPVAGQVDAALTRTMSAIDITNKISGEWQRSLSGVRQWSLHCSGLMIADPAGWVALEKAFMDGATVKIRLKNDDDSEYEGNALITSFPIDLKYRQEYVYDVNFLGTGILQ